MPPGTSLSWLTAISRAARVATSLKARMIYSLASLTAVSLAPDVLVPRSGSPFSLIAACVGPTGSCIF